MNQGMVEKLQNLAVSLQIVTVEDMRKHSIPQLVTMIANKMNELIQEVYRFETSVNEEIIKQNEKIQWMINEGLTLEVIEKLNEWLEDGTIASLINHTIFNELNQRLEQTELITNNNYNYITPRQTNDDIQSAINLAIELGKNKVMLEGKTYTVTDTIQVPSNFELCGVRRSSTIVMNGVNKPVINHTGSLKGGTILKDFNIRGDKTQPDNDGIKINNFYSSIDGVEINNCGGYGINWHTEGASGTLVENFISNVIVRSCGKDSYYLGSANNNKITDGFLLNCISCGSSTNKALFIGSGAGWQVNGLHTYGHGQCDGVIDIRNGFNTHIDNIYIEDFKGKGLNFSQVQKNLVINNVTGNIKTNTDGDQSLLHFNHSTVYNFPSNILINNVSVSCDNTGTTYLFTSDGSSVKVKVSNVNLSGTNIPTTLYNSKLNGGIEINSNVHVEGSISIKGALSDGNDCLRYNNVKIPVYHTFNFDGSNAITHKITIPQFYDYTHRLARISMIANRYWNGTGVLYYSAELLLVRKTDGNYKISVHQLGEPSGFTSLPSYTVNSEGELTITFTPSDGTGNGRTTLELFN